MRKTWYIALLPIGLVAWGITVMGASPVAEYPLGGISLIMGLSLLGASVVLPVVIWRSPIFGLVFYLLVCQGSAAFAVWASQVCLGWFGGLGAGDVGLMVALLAGLISVMGVGAMAPGVIVPWVRIWRWKRKRKGFYGERRDIEWVEERVEEIRKKFADIRETVGRASEEVEGVIASVQAGIAEEVRTLREVKGEVARTRGEVSDLEVLSEMRAKQVEGLARMLRKRRYVDYGVGFGLGVVGSALAHGLLKVLGAGG